MNGWKKPALLLAGFVGAFLALKYTLPFLWPFLAGGAVALMAEPVVSFSQQRLGLNRSLSAGLGVSVSLLGLFGLVALVGALAVKEMALLAGALPDIEDTAKQGIALLQNMLLDAAAQSPEGVRPLLEGSVSDFFGSGSALLERVTAQIPGAVGGFLGKVPNGALGLGTGLLASFMISARLPQLKAQFQRRLPPIWRERYLPALKRVRFAVGGWLKAQAKLCAITFFILTVGFLLLKIPYAPLIGFLVALVDAIPVLGTGTVLIPWAIVSLLQGAHLRAIGLLCIYGAALFTRTALEPRLVGKHLGLDALSTLVFLYLGFRLGGILGMLLAPILASAVKSVLSTKQ